VAERTLILVKPDGVARDLVGEVLGRFERKGLRIVALQLRTLDEGTAREHYAEHEGKAFFASLVEFITSGPLVAAVLEGSEAIANARNIIGATNPVTSAPGSIRGDLATEMSRNIVHGSDSAESAAREIGIFFPDL
jgi:nucleoside-diphosphate kinase